MHLARLVVIVALATACAPGAPPEAAPIDRLPPPGPACELEAPDDLAVHFTFAEPIVGARPPSERRARPAPPSPRLLLFPEREPEREAAALAALRLDACGPGHADVLQTALQIVRDMRRRGVARVDLPAGTLGLNVSGDAAKLTLSGSF